MLRDSILAPRSINTFATSANPCRAAWVRAVPISRSRCSSAAPRSNRRWTASTCPFLAAPRSADGPLLPPTCVQQPVAVESSSSYSVDGGSDPRRTPECAPGDRWSPCRSLRTSKLPLLYQRARPPLRGSVVCLHDQACWRLRLIAGAAPARRDRPSRRAVSEMRPMRHPSWTSALRYRAAGRGRVACRLASIASPRNSKTPSQLLLKASTPCVGATRARSRDQSELRLNYPRPR